MTRYEGSKTMVFVSDLTRISVSLRIAEKGKKWKGLIALYLLIIAACCIVFFFANRGSESRYWPGWYLLRLPGTAELQKTVDLLESSGIDGTISAVSAKVSYMAIPDIAEVSIANLDDVLVPGDPRRDEYISRVSELFKSDGADLVYLPAERSLAQYRKILRGIPGLSSYRLMDDSFSYNWISSFVFIGVALFFALLNKRGRPVVVGIAAILPLAVLICFIGPPAVFPALLVFTLSSSNPGIWGRRIHPVFSFVLLIGFFAAAAALFFAAVSVSHTSLFIAVSVSEIVSFIVMKRSRKSRQKKKTKKSSGFRRASGIISGRRDHRLFDPVSLTSSESPVQIGRRYPGLIAAAAILLTILLPVPGVSTHAPVPSAILNTDGFDVADLQRLSTSQSVQSLPDLSGLISSAAYQEGFLYGATYRFPMPGEKLSILNYRASDTSIATTETTITEYNNAWFDNLLNRELDQGVGRLFKSLGGPSPVSIVTGPPIAEAGTFRNLQIIFSGIAVIVMLMLVFLPAHGDLPVRGIYTPILTARRRAQAA